MNKYYSSKVFQFCAIVIISTLCLVLDTLTRIHFNKVSLPRNRPEYKALGVNGSVFDKSGKLLYRLLSSEAWKYPDDERIFLKMPNIYFYSESSDIVKYHITGDDGWINHDSKIGELGKNVVAVISDPEPKKIITIYGSNVGLNLDKNFFSSANDVKAIQGKNIVTSQGFSYDGNKQFLILNSKVWVTYAQ